jgi:hypothetical protein
MRYSIITCKRSTTEYLSNFINKLEVTFIRKDEELKRILLFVATILIGIVLGIIVTYLMI